MRLGKLEAPGEGVKEMMLFLPLVSADDEKV